VFDCSLQVREELTGVLPYKVVCVEGAEADDIIAVLTKETHQKEKVLVLSSDKDFVQLQKYSGVRQYNPGMEKYVSTEDPVAFIKEHIIRGDYSDGIPNFTSPDNIFIVGDRQKPITKIKVSEWIGMEPEEFCNESTLRGYRRNELLIDFDKIPNSVAGSILNEYHNTKVGTRMDLLNYLVINNLGDITESIGEF
jgi:hypothetical protein